VVYNKTAEHSLKKHLAAKNKPSDSGIVE